MAESGWHRTRDTAKMRHMTAADLIDISINTNCAQGIEAKLRKLCQYLDDIEREILLEACFAMATADGHMVVRCHTTQPQMLSPEGALDGKRMPQMSEKADLEFCWRLLCRAHHRPSCGGALRIMSGEAACAHDAPGGLGTCAKREYSQKDTVVGIDVLLPRHAGAQVAGKAAAACATLYPNSHRLLRVPVSSFAGRRGGGAGAGGPSSGCMCHPVANFLGCRGC